jgi:hypothetical protein
MLTRGCQALRSPMLVTNSLRVASRRAGLRQGFRDMPILSKLSQPTYPSLSLSSPEDMSKSSGTVILGGG